MPEGYKIIAIPLPQAPGNEAGLRWLIIEASSTELNLSSAACPLNLASGWKARPVETPEALPPIIIRESGGQTLVRLIETQTYDWRLEGTGMENFSVKSPLKNKNNQRWTLRNITGRAPEGQFTVVNHLGFSALHIRNEDNELLLTIPLEFVSKKLDFDTEYRRMTEDIADFCEQLLLTWSAPTSLRFSPEPTVAARLILERFIFLRNFLTPERLGIFLEVITRNPHSQLRTQAEWKPVGMARSSDFLSHPDKMLRSWHRHADGTPAPSEVLDIRKEDTHDTPPNRFIKFALAQFRQLCHEVMELKGKNSTVGTEASELILQLDAITARPFFRAISRLNRLPLDNQTLQKGEGYREILRAWLLTEAAATLNWKGQEDSYEGSTRDVATLYEYWIFLKLHTILDEINGMHRLSGPAPSFNSIDPFITENEGEILIHLKSGKQSRARFLLSQPHQADLRIDLHYERTFSKNSSAKSSGSYSRQFRPDYTLSIFPAKYDTEEQAEKDGKIAHLHFDAKYRASKLAQVFGDDDNNLEQEKQNAKSLSTYHRGDLLKMHTYNDALRQTIGSYVLYPGDTHDKTKLRKFHEIAPGVGALVMKPGKDECLNTLKAFLTDIFAHQASQFTQYRYISDTHHRIIEEDYGTVKEDEASYYVARTNAPCVMIWLKKKTAAIFKKHGFAYCHAVPRDHEAMGKLDLNLSVEIGSELIPCGGRRGEKITGLGWRAKITSARFMAKEKLHKFIKEKDLADHLTPNSVDHYLVFKFEEATEIKKLDLNTVHKKHRSGSKYMATSCAWKEILAAQPASNR